MASLLRRGLSRVAGRPALRGKLPVDLHFAPTPNGWKVTLLLEEAAIPYTVVPVDLGAGTQLTEDFLRISPNGRMPALVDPNAGAKLFESGAIMMHLADAYAGAHPFLPAPGEAGRNDVVQWLFWVNAGLGPMAGQLSHFNYYAPQVDPAGDHSYSVDRYRREYDRLISVCACAWPPARRPRRRPRPAPSPTARAARRAQVMERQLADADFLAGEYSIADMAAWPWVKPWRRWMGRTLDESGYPRTFRWYEAIKARPATSRAMGVMRAEAIEGQRQREQGTSKAALATMFKQAGSSYEPKPESKL